MNDYNTELAQKITDKATKNIAKWGVQSFERLGLAISEETGEIAQAILQYECEGKSVKQIRKETLDLAALCFQMLWKFDEEKPEIQVCPHVCPLCHMGMIWFVEEGKKPRLHCINGQCNFPKITAPQVYRKER